MDNIIPNDAENINENDVTVENNNGVHLPRVVQQHENKLHTNHPENKVTRKISRHTWNYRYEKLVSGEGYNTGRRMLKCITISAWEAQIKQQKTTPALFIDGQYFFKGIIQQDLFVDFVKLRYSPIFRQPIRYFSTYKDGDVNIHRLYTVLQRENYKLVTRPIHPLAEEKDNTIAADMAVNMMACAYESEPDINHMVMFAQHDFLIPIIQHLNNMSIGLTLGISPNIPISNYYLNQFNNIVNIVDLMQQANCLQAYSKEAVNIQQEKE